MDLNQFKQLWQGLPENSREDIRREILSPEALDRLRQLNRWRGSVSGGSLGGDKDS